MSNSASVSIFPIAARFWDLFLALSFRQGLWAVTVVVKWIWPHALHVRCDFSRGESELTRHGGGDVDHLEPPPLKADLLQ